MENNMLEEYRPCTNNKCPMVSVQDENVKSLLERHADKGCVILFDFEKVESFLEIIESLKTNKFTYTPLYKKKGVYERCLIIYNKDKDGKEIRFEELVFFVFQATGKYQFKTIPIKESTFTISDYLQKDDYYINPSPQCYSERHIRYLLNEIFLSC